jgi:hypothetical protein
MHSPPYQANLRYEIHNPHNAPFPLVAASSFAVATQETDFSCCEKLAHSTDTTKSQLSIPELELSHTSNSANLLLLLQHHLLLIKHHL